MDYPKRIALPNGCYWERGNDEYDGIPTANGEIYDNQGNQLTCYGCDEETAENLAKAMMVPARFPIGTKYLDHGRNPRECTVIDVLRTYNAKGEQIRQIRYVATHQFMGQTVTEYSIGVPIMGKEMDIPTLVPGFSKQEVDYVLQKADERVPIGRDAMGNAIAEKAYQHATQRMKMGMNPFYSSVEDLSKPVMAADVTRVAPPIIFKK